MTSTWHQQPETSHQDNERSHAVAEEQLLLNSHPAVLAAMVQHLQDRVLTLNVECRRQAARIVELETALRTAGITPETDTEEA